MHWIFINYLSGINNGTSVLLLLYCSSCEQQQWHHLWLPPGVLLTVLVLLLTSPAQSITTPGYADRISLFRAKGSLGLRNVSPIMPDRAGERNFYTACRSIAFLHHLEWMCQLKPCFISVKPKTNTFLFCG